MNVVFGILEELIFVTKELCVVVTQPAVSVRPTPLQSMKSVALNVMFFLRFSSVIDKYHSQVSLARTLDFVCIQYLE